MTVTDNRKEYFRRYYLDNKQKYTRDTHDEIKIEKRGRPKKPIPPFTIEQKKIILHFP